ncbi:hypothetical protein [Endothiovibrio diazotrophicus]
MSRQRHIFKCCNADCPVGHFEFTVDLTREAAATVHCPFCGTVCLAGPPRGETVAMRGGGALDGLPREPRPDELIPTRPHAPSKDDPE